MHTLAQRDEISDDYTLLEVARYIKSTMTANHPIPVYSTISKVDFNFYITPRLEIAVPSVRVLYRKGIRDPQLIKGVLEGGIAHEDGHAFLFPFMTRMNLTYSIVYGYVKDRGIEWNEGLFHRVENIVSDVFNELVIYHRRLPGWSKLPETRYHYVYKTIEPHAPRPTNPISRLLDTHTRAFSDIYLGKSKVPRVEKPEALVDELYNMLSSLTADFDVERHTIIVNSGGLTTELAPLVFQYDMYDAVDALYKQLTSPSWKREELASIMSPGLRGNKHVYWVYYTTLTALYRYAVEHKDEMEHECPNIGVPKRPDAPPPEILGKILDKMKGSTKSSGRSSAEILHPDLADYAARRLISAVLTTSKQEYVDEVVSGTAKVPWYRRPRGKIDPKTLAYEDVLNWKVTVKIPLVVSAAKATSVAGVPDTITIVIDESGSTSTESPILSPLVGVDTTVFDVERVTAMAMMYNVSRINGGVLVNLVRFSSTHEVEQGTVSTMYSRLKNIKSSELQMGGTEIVPAVEEALKLHKDGRKNYFIILTDMEIPTEDAHKIKKLIMEHLKMSPVLVVAANASAPDPLLELNRYENIAVVGVKTLADYKKLEEAIVKLGKLILS